MTEAKIKHIQFIEFIENSKYNTVQPHQWKIHTQKKILHKGIKTQYNSFIKLKSAQVTLLSPNKKSERSNFNKIPKKINRIQKTSAHKHLSEGNLSKQFISLGQIPANQLLDQQFKQQFGKITKYSQFKNTVNNNNNVLKFLKPYSKYARKKISNIELKHLIYQDYSKKEVTQDVYMEEKPSIIQYLTQYYPNPQPVQYSGNTPKRYSNLIRQKIRYRSSKSQYSKRIKDIRQGKSRQQQNLYQ